MPISRAQRSQFYNVVYSATTKSFATKPKRVNYAETRLVKRSDCVELVTEKTAKLSMTGRSNLNGQNVQFHVEQMESNIATSFVFM